MPTVGVVTWLLSTNEGDYRSTLTFLLLQSDDGATLVQTGADAGARRAAVDNRRTSATGSASSYSGRSRRETWDVARRSTRRRGGRASSAGRRHTSRAAAADASPLRRLDHRTTAARTGWFSERSYVREYEPVRTSTRPETPNGMLVQFSRYDF